MNSSIIHTRSPLRIGLAGGGTDIKTYYKEYSGAVINFAIRKYHFIILKTSNNSNFKYLNQNSNKLYEFNKNSLVYNKKDEYCLISATIKYFIDTFNLEIIPLEFNIFSEAPRGSGLGASSSLVVGLVSSLAKYYGISLNNIEISNIAYTIERVHLDLDGGTQDQYVTTYGGLNFIEFQKNENIIVSPLILDSETKSHFESHFVSFFTGVSRESELIIRDQRNSISKLQKIKLMEGLTNNANEMKNAILLKKYSDIPFLLNEGFRIKKKVSNKVSNSSINKILSDIKDIGVLGAKISGAGGGGYVSCYIDLNKRVELYSYLRKNNFSFFNCLIHEENIKSYVLHK